MISTLRSLLKPKAAQAAMAHATHAMVIAPERPVYAIGDIHGCHDSMVALLELIAQDTAEDAARVFLGDVIDRGPASAAVLVDVFRLTTDHPQDNIMIMGNHERMMLDFLDDPVGRGAHWLHHGGLQTLASFGITGGAAHCAAEDALGLADALQAAMPDGMLHWLRALPLQWHSGNVYCVHAAMNPGKSPDRQSERSLLWGHPRFLRDRREDGLCVVHGHTIMPGPVAADGRVSLDTGAYRGGCLSAALLTPDRCQFIQVAGHRQ